MYMHEMNCPCYVKGLINRKKVILFRCNSHDHPKIVPFFTFAFGFWKNR